MIIEAITALKERGGSSRKAMLKYIIANHSEKVTNADKAKVQINKSIRRMLVAEQIVGKLVPINGSFRLPKDVEQKIIRESKKGEGPVFTKKYKARKSVKTSHKKTEPQFPKLQAQFLNLLHGLSASN